MAILRDISLKIKDFPRFLRQDIFVVLVVVLTSLAAFGLGRLSVIYSTNDRLQVIYPENQAAAVANSSNGGAENQAPRGKYVASVSGSKYHLLTCPGASAIKEENKLYFDTKEEAEAAGYTPAANCPGL